MKRSLLGVCLFLLCCLTVSAQSKMDSLQHIGEVVVTSRLTFREVIPSQQLNGEALGRLSSQSVADAMRYFSGVQLKDYGGVGGVKTVDVRSMGTNHLAVSYDGATLGNAQNGQIDLGQFSLDNVEEITLYNGQKSAIFQPASDFASASSVYIRTRTPRFEVGKNSHFKIRVKYGASNLVRLSSLYEHRLNANLSLGINGEMLNADGHYKFRYRRKNPDHTLAWDTTATRQNGDIHAERIEANLHGLMHEGVWQLKAYFYNSQRGIPGAVVNNVWRRGERQSDLNHFYQAHLQKSFGPHFSTQWIAKYADYHTHYANRDTTVLPVSHSYHQQEFYLSTANVLEITPGWSASVSYDLRWNKLGADTYRFAKPTRWSNLVSAATAIDYRHLKVQASIVGTFIHDRTLLPRATNRISRATPALFANVYPLKGKWLSFRAYVKQSYRMPTFNDLYYTDFGNANLKPERATQIDFGTVIERTFKQGILRHVSLHADVYYNRVKDKIVAFPKGQQFRWTMLNLGLVSIHGADINAAATLSLTHKISATVRAAYTYQRAIDITNSEDCYYRDQIPYIPHHAGSLIVGIDGPQWSLNYSFLYTGERYNAQENSRFNHMQPWYTSDLAASYSYRHWKLTLEVNNLLNQQYDVIVNYPMPGRNAAIGIEYAF